MSIPEIDIHSVELSNLESARNELLEQVGSLVPVELVPDYSVDDLAAFGKEAWAALEAADNRQLQLILRSMIQVVTAQKTPTGIVASMTLQSLPGLAPISYSLSI